MPRVVSVKVERLNPKEIKQVSKARKSPAQALAQAQAQAQIPDVKVKIKQELITDHLKVEKKRKVFDRFNGTSKEELMTRVLPDRLKENLDIVFIGINPGLFAAYKQHYYAGPGNHFWKCLFLSGLVPEPMTSDDDESINDFGIGFTNMVARTTPGSADLTRTEIKEGSKILLEKIQRFKPRIVVFNGKGIYEVFNSCFGDKNKNFPIGKQSHFFPGTESYIYVVPSSSARCAQLPRAIDKVPFYAALKKFRDYLKGDLNKLDENEVMFPDLEMVAAPVEPEARAIFIEQKRIRDEEKKAERLRIKLEKKVKSEEEVLDGSLGRLFGEEGEEEEGGAGERRKRASQSPAHNGKKGGAKQRKSVEGATATTPALQQQGPQQHQQQTLQNPAFIKSERLDDSYSPPIQTSPYFSATPNTSSTASFNGFSPPHPRQDSPSYRLPEVVVVPRNAPNNLAVDDPFHNAFSPLAPSVMNEAVVAADPSAVHCPTLSSTTPHSVPPMTTTHSSPLLSSALTTHSNPAVLQTSSTTDLTQMTPSLKQEDPHLLSALQFLNQNEMLNPQQMNEELSRYSQYLNTY